MKILSKTFDFEAVAKAADLKTIPAPKKNELLIDTIRGAILPHASVLLAELEKLGAECQKSMPHPDMRYPRQLLKMANSGKYAELGLVGIFTEADARGWIERTKDRNRAVRQRAYSNTIEPLATDLAERLVKAWSVVAEQAIRAEDAFFAEFGVEGSTIVSQSVLAELSKVRALQHELKSEIYSMRDGAIRKLMSYLQGISTFSCRP